MSVKYGDKEDLFYTFNVRAKYHETTGLVQCSPLKAILHVCRCQNISPCL